MTERASNQTEFQNEEATDTMSAAAEKTSGTVMFTAYAAKGGSHGSSGNQIEVEVAKFLAGLKGPRRIGPKDGEGICAATFARTDGKLARRKTALLSRTMYVLDIEQNKLTGEVPPPVADVVARIRGAWSVGVMAAIWTTHSHTPDAPRYRIVFMIDAPVIVPENKTEARRIFDKADARAGLILARQINLEGVTDPSKLGASSFFYLPSAESTAAVHDCVILEGRPVRAAALLSKAMREIEAEEAEQGKRAKEAMLASKARENGRSKLNLSGSNGGQQSGLIEAIRPHLPSISSILSDHGYKLIDARWLAPGSSSGMPGVVILTDDDGAERAFSHHSPASDPLANGHANDALDVLTILRFDGDLTAALRTLAKEYGIERDAFAEQNPEQPEPQAEKEDGGGADDDADAADDDDHWPAADELVAAPAAQKPYPIEALPPLIRNAVLEVAGYTQAPLGLVATSALVAAGAAVQGFVDVARSQKLTGPVSLFAMTVAVSGERKTTVDNFFGRAIRDFEAEIATAKAGDVRRYKTALEVFEAKRAGLVSGISAANKRGDNDELRALTVQLETLDEAIPACPRVPRLIVGDTTIEALQAAMAAYPVKLLTSSEGGVVLGGHSMKAEAVMRTMGVLNAGWDGVMPAVDRKGSGSTAELAVRLSVSLMVQPTALTEFMGANGKGARGIGLLARFLFLNPTTTQGKRSYKDEPESWPGLDGFNLKLRTILDDEIEFDENGQLKRVVMTMSAEGKAAWIAFHDMIEAELAPRRRLENFRDVGSKIADNCARVAGVLAAFTRGTSAQITRADISSAAEIMSWHLDEAMRFLGQVGVSPELTAAAKLSGWLVDHCNQHNVDRVTVRDARRLGPASVRTRDDMAKAIAELVDAGHIRTARVGKAHLILVNPALLTRG